MYFKAILETIPYTSGPAEGNTPTGRNPKTGPVTAKPRPLLPAARGGRYSFSLICSLSRPIAIRTITNDQANDPIMARAALSGCL